MKKLNLSDVQGAYDGGGSRLAPGGYVCGITKVTDVPDKEYLRIEYDIAEGEHKNHWRGVAQRVDKWPGVFVRSYKTKALPFFKGFITCVEKSNPGFKWDDDESKLTRKLVGLVLQEEEYLYNDDIRTRLSVKEVRTVDDIRKGNFKVPELKQLDDVRPRYGNSGDYGGLGTPKVDVPWQTAEPLGEPIVPVNDDDLPF